MLVHRLTLLQIRYSSPRSKLNFTFSAHTSFCIQVSQILPFCRVQEFRRFSEKSDVYAFGVFLLELVSGREASEPSPSSSSQTLVDWVCFHTQNHAESKSRSYNVTNVIYFVSQLVFIGVPDAKHNGLRGYTNDD